MFDKLLLFLRDLPQELITVIVATLPISELRGAIPLAYLSFKFPLMKAFILAFIGNLLPVLPLLLLFKPVSQKLRQFKIWRIFFERLFERTRKRAAIIEKYEALGLALFVAVPLPVTGAWTGCIAASIFGIRPRLAFWAISAGVFCAAIIVSIVTITGKGILYYLFIAR